MVNALGDAASAFTPARLGGEPMRFVQLVRAGVPGGTATVALAAERIIDLSLALAVALALGIGFGGMLGHAVLRLAREASSATGLALLGGVGLLIVISLVAARALRHRLPQPIAHSLRGAWTAARALTARRFLSAVVLTALSMAARTAVLPALVVGVVGARLVDVALGSFALIYGQLVLPIPAGAGAVELGFIGGFAGALPAAQLAGLLVTWRFFTLAFSPLIGAAMYVAVRMRKMAAGSAAPAALMLLSVTAAPNAASAQSASYSHRSVASRLLPTDHWTNEYIALLRARGLLDNLNPLVRPYTRVSVAEGLASLDPDTLGQPVAEWVRLLEDEFRPELDRLAERSAPAWGATVSAGGRASTSRRLDPLRPLGDEGAWPWYRLGAWGEAGPFVAEARLLGDNYLADAPDGSGDPDGLDPGQRRGGRTDHAYVTLEASGLSLLLGRLKRSWSLPGSGGLMVSDAPTPYPQLSLKLSLGSASITALTGELDTVLGQKRYLAAHRIDFASRRFVLSLGESVVYASPTGGLQFRYLNPVEVIFFDADNEPADLTVNVMLDAQVWSRVGEWVLAGEALLDDIDLDPKGQDRAPTRYAIALLAQWAPRASPLGVSLVYQQVSSFAYRTSRGVDRYTFLERSLGDNYADYDRLTLAAEWHGSIRGLTLRPTVHFQRQGEGGVRTPFPPVYDDFRRSPSLFLGVTETTYRLGLRGRYQPNRFFWVAWDAGQNFVTNARHSPGNDISEFQAVAKVGVSIELPGR